MKSIWKIQNLFKIGQKSDTSHEAPKHICIRCTWCHKSALVQLNGSRLLGYPNEHVTLLRYVCSACPVIPVHSMYTRHIQLYIECS
jgi:hypothetical protein